MNEYSHLTEGQLKMAMEEAEEKGDWEALSKMQLADRAESFAGMPVRFQATFIDRR